MALSTKQLKEYLWYVCKLEQDLFTLNNSIKDISSKINRLNRKSNVIPPKEPEKVSASSTFFKTIGMYILIAVGALLCLWLLGMGLCLICEILGLEKIENAVVYCVFGISILLLAFGIYSAIASVIDESKSYTRDMKRYKKDYELYKRELKESNNCRSNEKNRLISEKNRLVRLYNSQLNLLKKMYDLNIIHRNYRN